MGVWVDGWEVSTLALILQPELQHPPFTHANVSLVHGGLRCGCVQGVVGGLYGTEGVVGREQRWGGTYAEATGSAAAILLTKKGEKSVDEGKSDVLQKRDAKMSSAFL